MRVFKFGGASVKNAEAVKNVASIISRFTDRPLIVVVSAMAKTTNALEEVVRLWVTDPAAGVQRFAEVIEFHRAVAAELFAHMPQPVAKFLATQQAEVDALLHQPAPAAYGECYDQIVHRGELLSTYIIAAYLQHIGQSTTWLDTRQLVITNDAHRRATVNWEKTGRLVKAAITQPAVYLVQGFIGSTADGKPTTLGREGSDYTAAVMANILEADEVTIWKDVPGVLNGDPKVFKDSVLLEEISYREAIELAYYGASVIHPKTIQPVQQKNIPLYVRSFLNPELPGTVIKKGLLLKPFVPCYIRKTDQLLISINTRDLAFIVEEHLQLIYSIFHAHGIMVNVMQSSAISSSFCVNNDSAIVPRAIAELEKHFDVRTNQNLQLYTVRHHNAQSRKALRGTKEPLIEQVTRQTYQVVLPG
jgi:aspartate kinase